MPPDRDDSDHPSTLPSPELNPLLNPLLAQNMGRWAEVYFTAPPEKREQAVLDLVHELEAESGSPSAEPATTHRPAGGQAPPAEPRPAAQNIYADTNPVDCPSCGCKNPENQKFCGMCGALLSRDAARANPVSQNSAPARSFIAEPSMESESAPLRFTALPAFTPVEAEPSRVRLEIESRYRHALDLSRQGVSTLSRYRIYIGGALAVLVLGLGYLALRGTQAMTGAVRYAPSAPQAVAPQQPAAVQTHPPAGPALSNGAPDGSSHDSSGATASSPAAAAASQAPQPARGIEPAVTDELNPTPPTSPVSGSDELATAESYLNGTGGKERDPAEAVKWLWKSVGKQNAAATLLLSDLYVKGEDVAKNCEQARLLLDAAARKGVPGADQRLINLQTAGCQ